MGVRIRIPQSAATKPGVVREAGFNLEGTKIVGRLDGKVVFLTGAGAGIAKATARACTREGAKVVLFEINDAVGASAEKQIRDEGGDALFVHTDVTSDDSVRNAVEQGIKRFGRLDVIFNCAGGSSQEDRPVHEMDLDVWHKTIALNLLHPFLTCRHGKIGRAHV